MGVSLALNVYGIWWGLPDRWNVDEDVARALRVIGERSIISRDLIHPPLYKFFLAAILAPYFLLLKAIGYPLEAVRQAASVSWLTMASEFPDFARNVYLLARFSSAVLGTATVYLVFCLGRRLFGAPAGLMGAALLALSMEFVSDSHFARSSPLVNFMGAAVVLLGVRALQDGRRRDLSWAAFLSGLAFTAKYNGAVLLVPTLAAHLIIQMRGRGAPEDPGARRLGVLLQRWLTSGLLFLLGVAAGWPGLLLDAAVFVEQLTTSSRFYGGFLYAREARISFPVGALNYLLELLRGFGAPLGVAVLVGAGLGLRRLRERQELWLLYLLAVPYFALASTYQLPDARSKFLMLVIPLLAVFGGLALARLAQSRALGKTATTAVLAVVFGYSFAYSAYADQVFTRLDTRYASTQWILANIPPGNSLEMLHDIAWLASARIIPRYQVLYLGRSSRDPAGGSLFKISESGVPELESRRLAAHCDRLRSGAISGEYVLAFLDNVADRNRPDSVPG
ncbi:MAG: glycosyltransferase family 39 protein [Deltaproteobacteria bacterium]|nr:glycosyltransferase family 39 protein [Deltaproteobacteria bacterium]